MLINNTLLAIGISLATSIVLILALLASFVFRRINAETASVKGRAINSGNISDRKHSEEILKRYQLLSEQARDIVLFVRPEGQIIEANNAALKAYGYQREELLSLKIQDIRAPETHALLAEQMAQADKKGILFETIHRRKDGSTFPVEVSSQGTVDGNQRVLLSIIREITERKQAEVALQKQTQRERLIGAIAIQQSELYQQVQLLNAELERQVQERTAQLQQARDFDAMLKRITDKVRDSLDEDQILQTAVRELVQVLNLVSCNLALYNLEQGTATICYEYQTSRPFYKARVLQMAKFPEIYNPLLQGECFQFCSLLPNPVRGKTAMLACPIFDDRGVLGDLWLAHSDDYGFNNLEIGLVQQVANQCAIAIRQARLYQAVQAQVVELERLNSLKEDFLSTVSHELRTPVANMKMAMQMLEIALNQERASISEIPNLQAQQSKTSRYLQILKNECERESRLINELLDLQRLDAGSQSLVLTAMQLQGWLPQIVEPFQERIKNHQQTLRINIATDMPDLVSDPSSLERIVAELLNNACKYTPPGEEIIITASAKSGKIELSVSNSGVEIAPSELPRIFDKFYRIPSADPWKQGGTGLGLALVKTLIEHLGGKIWVESGSGQTCFKVELPIKGRVQRLEEKANSKR